MVHTTLSRKFKTEKKYIGHSARIAYQRISFPPSVANAQILTEKQINSIIIIAEIHGPCALFTKNATIHTNILSACVIKRKELNEYSRRAMPCEKYNNAESAVKRYRLTYSTDSFSLKLIFLLCNLLMSAAS